MAEAAKQPEQTESMEEILQSIKKIMDDNTVGDVKPAADADVFDLTNVVNEEKPKDIKPLEETPALKTPTPETTPDIAKSVEAIFAEEKPAATAAPATPTPAPAPAVKTPVADTEAALMSEFAATAAAAAFKQISEGAHKDMSIPNIPSPNTRSGATVEDLILEALRPMLKEWLDKNLPTIVQKIVEKEVKRIVTFHYD